MSARTVSSWLVVIGLLLMGGATLQGQDNSVKEKMLAAYRKGEALRKEGKNREAVRYYERAVELASDAYGEQSIEMATLLHNLANLYSDMYQYGKAEPLYQRSLKIAEARVGGDHPDVANTLGRLAELYRSIGQYAKAEPLYQRSLQIEEAKLGKDRPEVATTLNNLAGLYGAMGQYIKAEPLYQRSLQIRETKLGKEHLDVAQSLYNLANLYKSMGQYAKAEPLYQHSLKIVEVRLGEDHPLVAYPLNSLANLYQYMGQYAKAEPLYQRGLKIREAKLGKDDPNVAQSLNNLAYLYRSMGLYAKAEPLFQRSLRIWEAKLGKDHLDVAVALNGLAELYRSMGQYGEAEPLYQRSLQIREAKLGKQHRDVAANLNDLALLYDAMGQYAKAEPLYLRSHKILEAKLGKEHPDVALSLSNLATLYRYTGQYAKAEPLYQRSLKIMEVKLGKEHPDVSSSLNQLATLYAAREHWGDAGDAFERSRRSLHHYIQHVLPALSEREQLTFLQKHHERGFHAALSLALLRAKNDGDLSARAAAWLVNGKALTQQFLAEQTLLARDANGPNADEVRQLLDVRRRLAAQTLAAPKSGQETQHRQQLQSLGQQEQELAKRLAQAGGQNYSARSWIELKNLRRAIPADSIFIDIARFEILDFQAIGRQKHWGSARYVAWLTPKEGAVRVIDLGEADKIDAVVRQARQALDEAPKQLRHEGEIDAEKAAHQSLTQLANLVLKPLRSHLDGAERWIICPDGNLWLVPWAALPLDDQTYAVEKHTLQLVVSGRDLVASPHPRRIETTVPAIFANPDFDHAVGGTARLAGRGCLGAIGTWRVSFEFAEEGKVRIYNADGERYLAGEGTWTLSGEEFSIRTPFARFTGRLADGKATGERVIRKDGQTTRDRWEFRLPPKIIPEPGQTRGPATLPLGEWRPLPDTAIEAAVAAQRLQKLFDMAPQIRTEEKANTSAFLALRRPRALVLATHGFFLPDQELTAEERERLARDPHAKLRQRVEDPLLRCGLVLAGGNHASAGGDTGVLTGREVLSVDLRGCEMVVLSACQTGLGDVRNGEGVAGLRQAFQLAGASGVLASLWKVPSGDTTLLMAAFMDGLGQGQDRAKALAQAQRKRIAVRREKRGAAHPFFWSAFTLTGR